MHWQNAEAKICSVLPLKNCLESVKTVGSNYLTIISSTTTDICEILLVYYHEARPQGLCPIVDAFYDNGEKVSKAIKKLRSKIEIKKLNFICC